ncbi:hypothetical protein OB962_13300 [Aeromonas piscicola]|uniref:DNA mimic protein DMP19 C-terminal domain-containing protein n=1 Tax=Aeromonas piscicola TaxID=600645 RepID=A0ABT7QDG1_9GAMM|nr:hypothetical protein [Aeromonas piscicola]MDM5131958.1 hypothetical protein [Aeromonas piscicola]
MQSLTVDEILDKGISDETKLSEQDWPIFAVAYLESIADMEGWDHFFTHSMEWYPLVLRALKLAGDFNSLKIIDNYRKHIESFGVGFEATEIDKFLCFASDKYFSECADWHEEFSQAAEQRWKLINQYYLNVGAALKT